MGAQPLYLTDAERTLRTEDMQDRYRFYACFRLKGIQYTRWFADPGSRSAYIGNFPDCQVMNMGEGETSDLRAFNADLLRGVNR